jgi:HSP20 family molecular chaperone IbpA
LTPDYWNRQIERWMDIFTDDETDLMGLELVGGFDNLARKLYSDFDVDLDEWTESSEIYVCIRSEAVREEVDSGLDRSHPVAKPNKHAMIRKLKRRVETVSVSGKTIESGIEKVGQDTSEDVIVSDKNIKMVLQLPTNNKKGNIKVVANSDNSITISHLNNEGKRCTYTLDVQYNIDFDTAKATYKNGILEVTFDRK